ncbi:MAG: phosphate signaling complex protein PhoU [Halioglobus sp.]|nr:phosphate signaling complex protein PhoU [Halioglobus sp.]
MSNNEHYQDHISGKFNSELESLRNQLLAMGGLVEQQLVGSLEALQKIDTGDAETVIDRDAEVNRIEMSIDQECAAIIARRQPTASDLRLVLAITKANTDLERIGDEAAKVAKQVLRISDDAESPSKLIEVRHIGEHVAAMLRGALDAFARMDVSQAVEVVKRDAEVDREYGSAVRSLVTFMVEDPKCVGVILNEILALRSLERVGDHACNIAEHVVYLVEGLDVRHGRLDELREAISAS